MIERLKAELEAAVGRKMRTPRDFDMLNKMISGRVGENVSASTLKRLWGYFPSVEPHTSTLVILAQFLGYRDWDTFRNSESGTPPSSPIIGRWLDVERELNVGDRVRVTWAPGRVCDIEYMGDLRFPVLAAEQTRLQAGDTFECTAMLEQQPLYLRNLRHAGMREPMSYVCGMQGGIHFERLMKS